MKELKRKMSVEVVIWQERGSMKKVNNKNI
jgi:hypothetical protein